MSKRGKRSLNRRGKNSGKNSKPHNPKQRRMDQQQGIPPIELDNPGSGSSSPKLEYLTRAQTSEFYTRTVDPGSSILARYLAAEPGVSLRDLDLGPSTSAGPSVAGQSFSSYSDSGPIDLSMHTEEGPIDLSRDSGAGPSSRSSDPGPGPLDLSTDSRAGPSTRSRVLQAGPSTRSSVPGAGPSTQSSASGAGPSTQSSGSGAGPSTQSSVSGAGPTTQSSDSGAGPSTYPSYSGAGPSTWHRDSGAGPSTQASTLEISSLDYDENLKKSIVSKFLGVPKCVRDAIEEEKRLKELQEAANKTDNENLTTEADSNTQKIDDPDFKVPSSNLNPEASASDEPQASTSKEDNQVSTSFIDKPNSNQISEISSSISEKTWRGQETVVSSSDVQILAESMHKCEISTNDIKLEIRHVQDIEREILQMDIVRESNNSPDYGRQFIQSLAASLLKLNAPIVLDDYQPQVAWPKNKSRVPYVFLHPPIEFRSHMKTILARNIQFYHPQRGTHYTKILGPTFEDQQNLVQYFDEFQMPYHTFGNPLEKMARVVIRGLSGDIDLVKLKEELIASCIPIERLHKMRYNGMHKNKWHIILAIVPHSVEGFRLLKVRRIFGQDVIMEPAKSKTKQCHRCQRWGHAQRFCRGRVKCVKCAGDHFSEQCTRDPEEEPPSCANCGGDHPASYRQCFHCPDSAIYKSWQKKKKTDKHKFLRVLATSENCDTFYDHDRVNTKSLE